MKKLKQFTTRKLWKTDEKEQKNKRAILWKTETVYNMK